MFEINIDIKDTVDEFSLSEIQVNEMCNAVSEALTIEIHRNWGEAAKQGLQSTRNGYLRGLILRNEGNGEHSIVLVGKLNNMIESGSEGFDEKIGFAKSNKVKFDKNGNWYLVIPFRHATPDAVGESEVFDSVMPQEIYDLIKDKTPQISDNQGNITQQGESLSASEIPAAYQTPTTRQSVIISSINKVFDEYVAKTSQYEGLIRSQKTYESATSSQYNTFRKVSAKSDPNSWVHPGFEAKNFSEKGLENTSTDLIVDNAVDKILASYGF